MTVATLKKQILRIENALRAVKRRTFADEPNFAVDEKSWNAVRRDAKRARAEAYQRTYGGKHELIASLRQTK